MKILKFVWFCFTPLMSFLLISSILFILPSCDENNDGDVFRISLRETSAGFEPIVAPISKETFHSIFEGGGWNFYTNKFVMSDGSIVTVEDYYGDMVLGYNSKRTYFFTEDGIMKFRPTNLPTGQEVTEEDINDMIEDCQYYYDEHTNKLTISHKSGNESCTIISISSQIIICTKRYYSEDKNLVFGYCECYRVSENVLSELRSGNYWVDL